MRYLGMKKHFAVIMILILTLALPGCANNSGANSAPGAGQTNPNVTEPLDQTPDATKDDFVKKACFITTSPLGNEFTDLIWSGLKKLEAEGWEIKCIETSEVAEYPDQIRAMAAEGYTTMFTMFDELSQVALDLSDELKEDYPDLHIFMLDTYMEHDKTNCTSVSVDPFESSFVAGFVAANMTDKDIVGWIGHKDILKIQRFRDGYTAGVNYANKGKEVISAFTGDPFDPVKGLETARTMIQNNDVDIIYQSAYLGGPGVIQACAEAGIRCIGVDNWQGYIDPCVFWSAVKPMDIAIQTLAKEYAQGRVFETSIDFDLSSGGAVYDERDEQNLPPELLEEVKQLVQDIRNGKIDVFEGYDQYRLNY